MHLEEVEGRAGTDKRQPALGRAGLVVLLRPPRRRRVFRDKRPRQQQAFAELKRGLEGVAAERVEVQMFLAQLRHPVAVEEEGES